MSLSRIKSSFFVCLAALLLAGSRSVTLAQTGSPWSWGYNSAFELGVGNANNASRNTPVSPLNLANANIIQVAGSSGNSIALTSSGTVWVWGWNIFGQLGDGTTTDSGVPRQMSGLTGVTQIAAGGGQYYVLKSDGTVWAWGRNQYSDLGDGTTTERHAPVQVQGLSNIVQIAGRESSGTALRSDGTAWRWGTDFRGLNATAVQMKGLTGVVQVAPGSLHELYLKSDGTVWAAGFNTYGQLGDATNNYSLNLVQVKGLTNVVQVIAYANNSAALTSDGTVWTWGNNDSGQIGDGTTNSRNTPFAAFTGAVQVSIGNAHTIALKSDGTVWGWGNNPNGELGDGTNTNRYAPVQTLNLTNQTFIATGQYHNLSVQATLQNTSIGAGSLTLAYASGVGARLNTKSYGSRIVYRPLDFTVDGVSIGSARTFATGTATVPLTPAFGVGTHTVIASFAGDRLYNPSSKKFTITITPAATAIVATKAALYRGVAANLKATLTRKTDSGHPANESVTFKIDGTVIGTAITDGTGTATLAYTADTTFSIGSHNLTAEFAGDGNHNGSASANAALTLSKNKTTLTQGNVSRAAGSKVTLTATLKQATGKIPQSGKTITFSVDGMMVGTGVTNASGVASYIYTVPSTASLGVHPMSVSFDEDDYDLAATYSAATLTVK